MSNVVKFPVKAKPEAKVPKTPPAGNFYFSVESDSEFRLIFVNIKKRKMIDEILVTPAQLLEALKKL